MDEDFTRKFEEEEEEDQGLPKSSIPRESIFAAEREAIPPAATAAASIPQKRSNEAKNSERRRRRAKLALATAIEKESRRQRTQ